MTLLTNIKIGRKIKRIKLGESEGCVSESQEVMQNLFEQIEQNAFALEKARRKLYKNVII